MTDTKEALKPSPDQKKITVTYTEDEIFARLDDLNRDPDIELFLKVQRGVSKFEELQKLSQIVRK